MTDNPLLAKSIGMLGGAALGMAGGGESGGYKDSGIGRLHGVEGLDAFLQTKHVVWQA